MSHLPPSSYILLIILSLSSPLAAAATFTVTNLDDSGAGSLRQAILNANAAAGDDTIAFQSGLSGTILLSSQIEPGNQNLTINGPGASVLAISGNNVTRIFAGNSMTLTINNLTLKNGRSSTGGAIYAGGTMTINQCVLSNNVSTGTGGAIDNLGTMTITNSILSGNSAGIRGGAIFNRSPTNEGLTIINSTLSGNSATAAGIYASGGGIYSGNSTVLTITNSTLSGNSATRIDGTGSDSGGVGGGIYFTGNKLTITNGTLSGNSANSPTCPTSQCSRGLGGGLYASDSNKKNNMSVLNSTFTGNAAVNDGGGIYVPYGTLTMGNTISL